MKEAQLETGQCVNACQHFSMYFTIGTYRHG